MERREREKALEETVLVISGRTQRGIRLEKLISPHLSQTGGVLKFKNNIRVVSHWYSAIFDMLLVLRRLKMLPEFCLS